jgi:ABC-type Mn2+/Zn2+ transport system ATPase subunit
VSSLPGVQRLTLVVEKRRLEGNQEVLDYTEVARVPMQARREGQRTGPQMGRQSQVVSRGDGSDAHRLADTAANRQVWLEHIGAGALRDIQKIEAGELAFAHCNRHRSARAHFGQPALVVLDEPNSSLDEAGDAALAVALQSLKARGATVVVMTHRSSILSVTDKILVLNDGVQQAFGPRDEVLSALKKGVQRQGATA